MSVGFAWQRSCTTVRQLSLGTHYTEDCDSAKNFCKELNLGWRRIFVSTQTLPVAAVLELRLQLLQHECERCMPISCGN